MPAVKVPGPGSPIRICLEELAIAAGRRRLVVDVGSTICLEVGGEDLVGGPATAVQLEITLSTPRCSSFCEHVSCHSNRVWLHLPKSGRRRPPAARRWGPPRLPVPSETIAELYETGTSSTRSPFVSASTPTPPALATTRSAPNAGSPAAGFPPGPTRRPRPAADDRSAYHRPKPRSPARNEAHAARRAARDFARTGDATISYEALSWQERPGRYLILSRPS